jgi:hypothetical protein
METKPLIALVAAWNHRGEIRPKLNRWPDQQLSYDGRLNASGRFA